MWTILKFDKKNIGLLIRDIKEKIGEDYKIYVPKLIYQKFHNNKIVNKEINLLGDYMFCFHKNLNNIKNNRAYYNLKGLKYFLSGNEICQNEIINFIKKCKSLEDKKGYLSKSFYEIKIDKFYKFKTGPFTDKIFKIVELQKKKLNITIGKIRTSIKKEEFLFQPI